MIHVCNRVARTIMVMTLVGAQQGYCQQAQPAAAKTPAATTPATTKTPSPATAKTPGAPTSPAVTAPVTLPAIPTPPAVTAVATESVTTETPKSTVPVTQPAAVEVSKSAAALTEQVTTETPKGANAIDATLDTVDIQEGGNWLKVRKALENTVDMIENINVLFTKILDERMTFLKKRNKADKDFEKFLQAFGMDIGDFDRQMTQLVERLEQERKEDGDLTEEERAVLTAAQQKKEAIKELKEDIKNIAQYDTRIDDILMAFEDQINTCRDYQNQAWKNFQAIKKVYNDEKAERLYQKTETVYANMQAIYTYLQGDLTQYLDTTIQMLTDAMSKADASVKDLQAKGVNLRETLEKLEHKEKKPAAQPEQKVEPVVKKPTSWFSYITSVVSGIFGSIRSFFSSLVGSVMGIFIKKPAAAKPVAVPVEGGLKQNDTGKPSEPVKAAPEKQ